MRGKHEPSLVIIMFNSCEESLCGVGVAVKADAYEAHLLFYLCVGFEVIYKHWTGYTLHSDKLKMMEAHIIQRYGDCNACGIACT